MSFVDRSCTEFTDVLASKDPVPGGGGASALVAAIGAALGSMVCNLTVGKKKYAVVESEICDIMDKVRVLQAELLSLVDRDAEAFEPLAKAYGIPKDDPERASVMESALRVACSVPMDIMRTCCKVIDLHADLALKGSALAISDVGVGVICCKSALMGASLNVYINTKSMTDRAYAASLEEEADELLEKYCKKSDDIYGSVVAQLREMN